MRSVLKSILGFGLLGVPIAPVKANAQTPPSGASVPTLPSGNQWKVTSVLPKACTLMGIQNGYSFTLSASTDTPDAFTLDMMGAFPPNTPASATLMYGAGLTQTLTGTFTAPDDLQIRLANDAANNFATFLHGFTAGTEMSGTIGSIALNFSLAGTSTAVAKLGQCTTAGNFNNLPAPWRPAEDASSTPVAPETPATPVAAPDGQTETGLNIFTPEERREFLQAENEYQEKQHPDEVANGWYILARNNQCVSPWERTIANSPAEVIQYDADNGLVDNVVILQRDDAGNPIAVKVQEPEGNDMATTYDFYKGAANCSVAAASVASLLKNLN